MSNLVNADAINVIERKWKVRKVDGTSEKKARYKDRYNSNKFTHTHTHTPHLSLSFSWKILFKMTSGVDKEQFHFYHLRHSLF